MDRCSTIDSMAMLCQLKSTLWFQKGRMIGMHIVMFHLIGSVKLCLNRACITGSLEQGWSSSGANSFASSMMSYVAFLSSRWRHPIIVHWSGMITRILSRWALFFLCYNYQIYSGAQVWNDRHKFMEFLRANIIYLPKVQLVLRSCKNGMMNKHLFS